MTDLQAPAATDALLSNTALDIARFCAIECHLQMSGERSVWWMLDAWSLAERIGPPLVHDDVLALGARVEPMTNDNGYRRCGVRVGSSIKPDWEHVRDLMTELLDDAGQETPEEWFRRYEEVHPFRDGNGRTGAILYNWLRGSLDKPVWPPNFWNDQRRTAGFGAP